MSATESEWVTRKKRINPQLDALGWIITPFDPARPLASYSSHAIEEYPTASGPADYALVVDGQLLGILEAKRLSVGPAGVLTQAERYARGVADSPFDFRGLRVPFLYATNGERIHFHDIRNTLNQSRVVKQFHTPAALQELLGRDLAKAAGWFASHPNSHPRLRPYQVAANNAVEEAIGRRLRNMLVAMATGPARRSRW